MTNPERTQDKQDAAEVKNFTRSPNMLIFGYRELSPQEKWLYVCLKHLCGKRGTRHLALRYISEQTGISVGALSTSKDKKGNVNEGMIRHLHNAGLIHSEIKKKDGKGNAQYHITITDVWDLNQAFFIERKASRSEFGQDTGQEEDESTEPVRNSDEPVQSSDKPVRNSDEPVRIPGQYQERYKTTDKTDNKTREQESTYAAPESQPSESGSVEPTRTFAFQVQGYPHFYHDYCIHAQDRGINDGLTLVVKNLADVPPDAECSICYKLVHGPHGYGEPLEKGTSDGRSDDNDHLLSGHDRRDTSAVRGAEPVRVPSQQQAGKHEVHPAEPVAPRAGRSARTESGATQAGLVNENNTHSHLSTSMTTYPQQSAKVSRPSSKSAKQTEPKLPPTAEHTAPAMPPADAEWKTTTCLLMFTAWRGKPLLGTYKNSQASTCAKGLVQNYSRDDVEWTRNYMVNDDPWWSQHTEKVDVCTVASHIHEILPKRTSRPKPKSKSTLVSCANMSAEEYAAYLRR